MMKWYLMIRVILIIFGIILFIYIIVFSKNGIINRISLEKKEKQLNLEISRLNEELNKSKLIIEKLKSDSVYIETLAREKGMKKPREKYFKIKK